MVLSICRALFPDVSVNEFVSPHSALGGRYYYSRFKGEHVEAQRVTRNLPTAAKLVRDREA